MGPKPRGPKDPGPVGTADDGRAVAARVLRTGARSTLHGVVFVISCCSCCASAFARGRTSHPDQVGLVDDVLYQADGRCVDHLAIVSHGTKPLGLGLAIGFRHRTRRLDSGLRR